MAMAFNKKIGEPQQKGKTHQQKYRDTRELVYYYYYYFHLLFMLGYNKLKQTPLIFSFCLVDTLDGVSIQNITSFRPDSVNLLND